MSGSRRIEPAGATASIAIAPVPPRATTPRPSSGSRARSTGSPLAPTSSPGSERLARPRAADDAARDRQLGERRHHPRRGGLLRCLLVAAAEPAGSGERSPLGRLCVAACRGSSCAHQPLGARREHEVHDLPDRVVERRALDHGHVVPRARSSNASWIRRISGSPSRYFSSGRRPSVALSRTQKLLRCTSSSDDRDDAVHDERVVAVRGEHAGDEVDALEHHRPALGRAPGRSPPRRRPGRCGSARGSRAAPCRPRRPPRPW